MTEPESHSWYKEGLRFLCERCNKCCRWEGVVWVTREKMDEIGKFLSLSGEDFKKEYCRWRGARFSFKDGANDDCIMFRDGCLIYPVRPLQCRTFPFWPWNVWSRENWDKAASECPGMNKGRLYSEEEIDQILRPFLDC